jgi:hypothetical protein
MQLCILHTPQRIQFAFHIDDPLTQAHNLKLSSPCPSYVLSFHSNEPRPPFRMAIRATPSRAVDQLFEKRHLALEVARWDDF